jgi:hypothetical protein
MSKPRVLDRYNFQAILKVVKRSLNNSLVCKSLQFHICLLTMLQQGGCVTIARSSICQIAKPTAANIAKYYICANITTTYILPNISESYICQDFRILHLPTLPNPTSANISESYVCQHCQILHLPAVINPFYICQFAELFFLLNFSHNYALKGVSH